MHDLVIRGGNVVDGSCTAGRTADVAVREGRIVEVGQVARGAAVARQEVDADGLLVTPGFVDIHTHYDAQVTWDPYLTPSSWHGCTTVVMGNCGVGFAPAAPERHEWLIGLMEGVEDIPGAALTEGIQWGWESFPEYLDSLDGQARAIDFGAQIPHGAVRAYVMGERGANNEDATAADLTDMAAIVRQGIAAGALGFSTSRTLLHKGIDGRHVPGTYAPADELFALGQAVQAGGGGVFQMACEHADVPAELQLMQELSQRYELPVMFNLSQFDASPNLWRDVLGQLDGINSGPGAANVKAQVAGRAIGIVMAWRGTAHPFALKPSWLQLYHAGWQAQWQALQDPALRQRLMDEEACFMGDFEAFVTGSFDKMYLIEDGYEPAPDQTVAARAAATGRRPEEVAMDALMADDGTGMLYFPLFNYSDGDHDALHTLHSSEHTRMGLSDAGAHCGAICDGGMPTFMLTHWTRDRARGERLPLEWVIHRQTAQTAAAFGLADRGLLRPGYRADINVIDYENLGLGRPGLTWDLPAGGRRLIQRAHGYRMTVCAGSVISEDDTATGELPGRLLRGRTEAPVPC